MEDSVQLVTVTLQEQVSPSLRLSGIFDVMQAWTTPVCGGLQLDDSLREYNNFQTTWYIFLKIMARIWSQDDGLWQDGPIFTFGDKLIHTTTRKFKPYKEEDLGGSQYNIYSILHLTHDHMPAEFYITKVARSRGGSKVSDALYSVDYAVRLARVKQHGVWKNIHEHLRCLPLHSTGLSHLYKWRTYSHNLGNHSLCPTNEFCTQITAEVYVCTRYIYIYIYIYILS